MDNDSGKGSYLNEAALIIYRLFNIPISELSDVAVILENLRNVLADRIQYLLVNDSELLMNILYRIDVNQSKVEVILGSDKFLEIPVMLADLVIERQLEKVKTRAKYKDTPKDQDKQLPENSQ